MKNPERIFKKIKQVISADQTIFFCPKTELEHHFETTTTRE